jgi:hypothetical protein
MIIKRKLFASQQGMVLLKDNKPREIGGITEEMELELADGTITTVYCVFFNLDSNVKSTDFFLFSVDSKHLITHSIGKRTNFLLRELYKKAIIKSIDMDLFLEEFVGNYIVEGLTGNLP